MTGGSGAVLAKDPTTAEVGAALPQQIHRPTTVQIFRFSAATSNTHRIHYDPAYAAREGYPDVLVQSHLHGAWLSQLVTSWIRPAGGRLVRLSVAVRRYAVPGDELVCRGTVTGVAESPAGRRLELEVEEVRTSDSTVCALGSAVVDVPAEGKDGGTGD
jgi:acyl dehydratase